MANFESLIRDALTKQDASNPEIRKKIYQSSRNALERMIQKAGNASPQAVAAQRKSLEEAIDRIEGDFGPLPANAPSAPAVNPATVRATHQPPSKKQASVFAPRQEAPQRPPQTTAPDQPIRGSGQQNNVQGEPRQSIDAGQGQQIDSSQRTEPGFDTAPVRVVDPVMENDFAANEPIVPEPAPELAGDYPLPEEPVTADPADYLDHVERGYDGPPPELRRKRRWPQRLAILFVVLLFFIFGWLLYSVLITYVREYTDGPKIKHPENHAASTYISILTPDDTSGLITAGRGTAQIMDVAEKKFIRIQSIRPEGAHNESAKPILIELKPGVLEQVAGKKDVNIEIQSKSGQQGQVQFAVECDFGEVEGCERFRFRLGVQPDAVVIGDVNFPETISQSKPLYLAINTDVTPQAAKTGKGELIDIYYARFRIDE